MQDVRVREEKLRKREEDLKIKEAQLRETENKQAHLEAYIERVEARNQELEKTIRILRRRIAVYETAEEDMTEPRDAGVQIPVTEHMPTMTSKSGITQSEQASTSDSLIQRVHDRVSQYVLRKIDNELDSLLQDNVKNVNTNITENPTASNPPHSVYSAPQTPYVPPTYAQCATQQNPGYIQTPQAEFTRTFVPHARFTAPYTQHVHGHPLYYSDRSNPQQPTSGAQHIQHHHFLAERQRVRPFQ